MVRSSAGGSFPAMIQNWMNAAKACVSGLIFFVEEMERVMGIEPTYQAWEARVLPLNYTREGHGRVNGGGRLSNGLRRWRLEPAFTQTLTVLTNLKKVSPAA